ncbi:MAG: tyrosine--tRNA ligase [Longimicrobiales bacterium]
MTRVDTASTLSRMQRFPPVNEQLDEIRRGTLEIIPEEDLARKIQRSAQDRSPLIIKQGFDPTRPDLHIGHAVSIRKLRTFQELGHQVVFVVGDYTARVGDPSGRSETRPRLSAEEIDANAHTYAEQVGQILDLERVRIDYNSSWLAPLDLATILELTSTYTVARMLERDDFARRYDEQRPIALSEFLYPLMQAYDSVALNADVELGGNDQKFNLLVGRTVQERYGQEPQVCLILPLLRGTDGVQKMSKSYDNYIGISEPAIEQFGKTMSIPDDLLDEWYRLAVPLTDRELDTALLQVHDDPYRAKRALGRRIVTLFHDRAAADAAEAHFDRLFREHALPEEIPTIEISLSDPRLRYDPDRGVRLVGLIVAANLTASGAEAGRLVGQGAISVDQQRITDRHATIPVVDGATVLVQRGKRQFVRIAFIRP